MSELVCAWLSVAEALLVQDCDGDTVGERDCEPLGAWLLVGELETDDTCEADLECDKLPVVEPDRDKLPVAEPLGEPV